MPPALTPHDFAGARKPLEQASWLPAHAYNKPEVWRQEVERVLRPQWLVACRADQVAKPGSFITKEIGGARVLVVRGADGVIRAFHNVCRHRGMWVAEGCGQARNFVCPYHSWTYDLRGELTAAPEMGATLGFDRSMHGLQPIRCENWLGFIAINLDGKAAPFGSNLTELADFIAPWRLEEMVTAHERVYTTTWDWKLMWENAIEGYHTSFLHRSSAGDAIPTTLSWVSEALDGRPWSDLHHPYVDELPPPAPEAPPAIEGLPAFARQKLVFFHVWPCLGFYLSPDKITSYICEPIAPGRHRFVWRLLVPPDTTQTAYYATWRESVAERYDVIQSEDEKACAGVQAGIDSGAWSPGRYSNKERACWHFHRWYAECMVGPAD